MSTNKKLVLTSFITAIVVLIFTSCMFVFGFFVYNTYFASSNISDYDKIKDEVLDYYDGTVDSDYMHESIVDGIVAGLGDPHSDYFTPEELESFEQSLSTSFKGIGIGYNVNEEENNIIVTQVFEEGTAREEGVFPGDVITSVNGEELTEDNILDVSNMIKENDTAKLEGIRPSEDDMSLSFDIPLGKISTPSVTSRVDEYDGKTISYISISSFSDTTGDEFVDILNKYEKDGIDGLVIDVRNNGGGYLSSVSTILDNLVTNEKPYLITKKGDEVESESYSQNSTKKDYDIVLIQNENTASASEVLSGALLELNNSEIVGKKSYGKGSVQQTFELSNNKGAVKITTEHWFTPDGNSIDNEGIDPTIEIEDTESIIYINPIVLTEKLSNGDYSTNSQITNYYLAILGYDVEKLSNNYDSKTETAIKKFQAENKLEVTGILDVKTADLLSTKTMNLATEVDNDIYVKKAYETIK